MGARPDRGHVRLAELVAALSLGIDLGFGQPMEHVLRQCLIALRLAERLGARAGDARRRLLHRPARQRRLPHGRARAGEVVRRRHRAQGRQVRPRAAERARAGLRRCAGSASGNPPLHRLRVGLAFAIVRPQGARRHVRPARRAGRASLAEQLGLPGRRASRPAQRVRAVGRARLAERARGRRDPARRAHRRSSRSTSRWRTGSAASTARRRWRAGARARSSIPRSRRCSAPTPRRIFGGLDAVGTWDAVIDAEPALAVRAHGRALRRGARGDRELRRPEVALLARPLARRRRPRRRGRRRSSGSRQARSATLRRAGLVHDFGRLGVSNAIWDKRGPLGAGEWERVRMHPVPHRAHAARVDGCWRRSGAIAVQHRERLDGSGYPRGDVGRRDLPRRRASWARPTPTRRCASRARTAPRARPTKPPRELRAGVQGGPPRRRRGRRRARRRRPPGAAAPRGACRADARARSRCCGCSPRGCPTRRSPRGS